MCPRIQIDEQLAHLGRYADSAPALVGDFVETLRALLPRLHNRTDFAFLDGVVEHRQDAVERLQIYVEHQGSNDGLRPEMVAAALSELAADYAVWGVNTRPMA